MIVVEIKKSETREELQKRFMAAMNTTWLGFEQAVSFLLNNMPLDALPDVVTAFEKEQALKNA